MDAPMDGRKLIFLNLINTDFMDLLFFESSVPISLIFSKVSGEVKQPNEWSNDKNVHKPMFVELAFVFVFAPIT